MLAEFALDTTSIWCRDEPLGDRAARLADALHWRSEALAVERLRIAQRRVLQDFANTLRDAEHARVEVPPTLRRFVLELYGWRCQNPHCDAPYAHPTVDHIVSRYLGGTNALANLHVLCRACNGRTGWRSWIEFLANEAPR